MRAQETRALAEGWLAAPLACDERSRTAGRFSSIRRKRPASGAANHRLGGAPGVGHSSDPERDLRKPRRRTTSPSAASGSAASRSPPPPCGLRGWRSEEHTSELRSLAYLVCR